MQAATEETGTPVVFAAVSDPVSVGLVDSLEAPGSNLTGTSDYLDTAAVMNLMFVQNPELQKVGLLYDLGQDSAASAIESAKAYLEGKGVEVIERTGTSVDEIALAAQALVSDGVQAVFTPTDNTVMKSELTIYETFAEAGIPHYTGADSFALNGAFLGYGVDYANLGVETANMIASILLDGADPAATAVKTFDNGTICASEQSIVTESVIAAQVKRALIAQGGFFLEGENLTRVKAVMERGNGSMNPAIVGRDAMTIARIAGIEVPAGTRLLISDEQGVGAKFPFSKEKLTALLGFYVVNDWHQACELCHALLHNCGIGHSLAIHSNNEDVIREFGLKKPVSRILVNTPSTQGGVGLTTALFPSFTLGCGAVGGSATSDNVTPMNLLNIRRVAYDLGSSMCRHHDCHAEAPKSCCSAASSCANAAGTSSIDINAITSLIVAELKKVM